MRVPTTFSVVCPFPRGYKEAGRFQYYKMDFQYIGESLLVRQSKENKSIIRTIQENLLDGIPAHGGKNPQLNNESMDVLIQLRSLVLQDSHIIQVIQLHILLGPSFMWKMQ